MLPFFSKTLRRWIMPPGADKDPQGLEFWRNEFFFMICRLFFLGGIFLYVISISSYLREGAEQMVFPISVLTAILFTMIFWRKLPVRIRRYGIIVVFIQGEAVRKNVEDEPLPQNSGGLNVMVDAQRFKQIMNNLLNNAVKFTPPGGRAGIKVQQTDDALLIAVWDSGIGIPEKDIPLLFDPFFKAENRSGEDVEGTGLGLSLVKQLVEAHGWQVTVESVLDQGSIFTIHIPLSVLTTEDPAAVYY